MFNDFHMTRKTSPASKSRSSWKSFDRVYLLSPVQEAGMCLFLKFDLFFIIGKIGFGRRNETQIKRKHAQEMWLEQNLSWEMGSLYPLPAPTSKPSLKTIVQRQQTKREFNYQQVFLSISRCWVVSTLEKPQEHLGACLQFCKTLPCAYKFRVVYIFGAVCFSLTRLVAELISTSQCKSKNIYCIFSF